MKKRKLSVFICITFLSVCLIFAVLRDVFSMDEQMQEPVVQPSGKSLHGANRQIILSMGGSSDVAFLSWSGDEKGPAYLRVSEVKEELAQATSLKASVEKVLQGKNYRYTVRLDGLKAGTTYYYEIGDGVDFDSPLQFKAPDEQKESKILYLGDVQCDTSVKDYDRWGAMMEHIEQHDGDIAFAVIGGDMVNVPGDITQWNAFLDNCSIFRELPLMTVSGNHEGVHSNYTYKKQFAAPDNGPAVKALQEDFYYFDYGSCRFVMTDSSFLTDERKEELGKKVWNEYEDAIEDWMEDVLSQSDKPWNIVVTHHPPYGMHDKDTVSPQLRQLWTPIMEKNGVDLVLCGHQHVYMRTEKINGITYIMGNSGQRDSEYYNGYNAPFYCRMVYDDGPNYQIIKAAPGKLEIISYNQKGRIIDEISIKQESWFHIFEFFSSG